MPKKEQPKEKRKPGWLKPVSIFAAGIIAGSLGTAKIDKINHDIGNLSRQYAQAGIVNADDLARANYLAYGGKLTVNDLKNVETLSRDMQFGARGIHPLRFMETLNLHPLNEQERLRIENQVKDWLHDENWVPLNTRHISYVLDWAMLPANQDFARKLQLKRTNWWGRAVMRYLYTTHYNTPFSHPTPVSMERTRGEQTRVALRQQPPFRPTREQRGVLPQRRGGRRG